MIPDTYTAINEEEQKRGGGEDIVSIYKLFYSILINIHKYSYKISNYIYGIFIKGK